MLKALQSSKIKLLISFLFHHFISSAASCTLHFFSLNNLTSFYRFLKFHFFVCCFVILLTTCLSCNLILSFIYSELSLEPDNSAEVVVQAIKNMANIILNLISNGKFKDVHTHTRSNRLKSVLFVCC